MSTSPLSIMQSTLDLLGPYLPSPVRWCLSLSLRSLSSLPPSLANILPLLLSLFALYTAAMSMYSTARYAFRTTWFLLKWGTVAAGLAYLMGGGQHVTSTLRGAGSYANRLHNGYYGSAAQRGYNNVGGGWGQYATAAVVNALGGQGRGNGGNDDGLFGSSAPSSLGGILSYLQDPARAVGDFVTYLDIPNSNNEQSGTASRTRSQRKSKKAERRSNEELSEQLRNVGSTAAGWLSSVLNSNKDRWSESRARGRRTDETYEGR